jgi:hypothetical protein
MRPLAFILAAGFSFLALAHADAGQRVVKGEGRAVIAGKDLSSARKAALADALYDAAAKLQSRVRGASLVDSQGVIREESSILAEGRFSGYHILFEGREGAAFIVRIEAVGLTEEESCGGKRVDLDIREVRTRVASGIRGNVVGNVAEGLKRGVDLLGDGTAFRVSDQRHLRQTSGDERTHRSQYDYMAQMTNSLPSPAGYSLSGDLIVERVRSDGVLTNITDIVVRLNFTLKDNFTGARIKEIRRELIVPDRRSVFGWESLVGVTAAEPVQPHVDLTPLFEQVRDDLESELACKPLRALVQDSGNGGIVLSVGLEHGVERGDYFLVTLPNARNEWQVITIDDVTPSQSIARTLKAKPGIPINAIATLMR